MGHEIELKLLLPEHARRAFLRHPLLKTADDKRTARLDNIYYDTPELALRRHGIGLRLRRDGKTWIQTVKCAGEGAGGLTARPEWETPYAGRFDFSGVDDDAVRAHLERLSRRSVLEPLFETNFRRTSWSFGKVVLMLDHGWIAAEGRREGLCELELELTGDDGDIKALFDLAGQLAQRLPLMPAPRSKAERGLRLRAGTPEAPTKAAALALLADMPPAAAFRTIALSCLDQMQRNHAGVIASDDPEFIHQMRVAARRLRACLRLFAPALPAALAGELAPSLREMMAVLGRARDLDVLLAEIVAPVVAALPDEPRLAALAGVIAERRYEARRHAIDHLQSREFGQAMLRLAAALHAPLPAPAAPAAPADTIAAFAAARLKKLRRKVRTLARQARPDDMASLHALRIGIKRLRYALEFFAGLPAGKPHRRQAAKLAEIQGTLGELNDLASAGQFLTDCAGHDAQLREAVTLVGGWHGQRHADLIAGLPRLLAGLRRG